MNDSAPIALLAIVAFITVLVGAAILWNIAGIIGNVASTLP